VDSEAPHSVNTPVDVLRLSLRGHENEPRNRSRDGIASCAAV
jgi:hypothetical protein